MLVVFVSVLLILALSYYFLVVTYDSMSIEAGSSGFKGWFKGLFHRKKEYDYDLPSTSRGVSEGSYAWRHSSPSLNNPQPESIVRRYSRKSVHADAYLNDGRQRSFEDNISTKSQQSKSSKNSISLLVDAIKGKLTLEGLVKPAPPTEEFPVLTERAKEIVKCVWDESLDPYEVISEAFAIRITRRDLSTLKPGCWLNDEVINFYFNLIAQRSYERMDFPRVYVFNTFFFTSLSKRGYSAVQRWTKNINIFDHDIVLFPIHLGCHWCLAVYDRRSDTLRFLDSMLSDGSSYLQILLNYLTNESKQKFNGKYKTDDVILINKEQVPKQMNGYDCGVFTCRLAEYAARRVPFNFAQRHMPDFRRRILFEIVNKQLL